MNSQELCIVADMISVDIRRAIRRERERIANILENSEPEYTRDYGHDGDGEFDWDKTVAKIAEKIRNGN